MGSSTDSCLEFSSKDEMDFRLEYKLGKSSADCLDHLVMVLQLVFLKGQPLADKLASQMADLMDNYSVQKSDDETAQLKELWLEER